MRVLIACESSGRVRDAFLRRGHKAWSCDLKPCESDPTYHVQDDVLHLLSRDPWWDLVIAHPACTYLANSGAKHLYLGMKKEGGPNPERWRQMEEGAEFFRTFLALPCRVAIENPIMHGHAKVLVGEQQAQTIQPWWFGEEAFKATCLWLRGLPPLRPTNRLVPPKPGTPEHKRWSAVHREPPGPARQANRSRTFHGIAEAMAEQWGADLEARMAA